ncbi:allophanate hydrolase subunit 1 [Lunatimonas sp.]|uniref:5-oxoprolinase subunit B family protein n=1 Tax=Lunatimonas sp. TaxID=2060141 RepID=UPI00263BA5D4|nr:allophanate hydrolase subunit 1 [Lunatimonas sp.]
MEKTIRQISPEIIEISWPALISKEIAAEMLQLRSSLAEHLGDRLKDIRLGYHRLSVAIRAGTCQISELRTLLEDLSTGQRQVSSKRWQIPVCYDPSLAKDLSPFLKSTGLGLDELIRLHTGVGYLLHFYGFLPGFMYLGGLVPALHCRRKNFPERKVEKGSVAIGGSQTGIYPVESPGGWHVVGKTPLTLFDPVSGQLPPFTPGDVIQFFSIARTEYEQRLGSSVRTLEYEK